MGLAKKTSFKKNQFTHTNLSCGQKKRLGLIVALLEERPVLLLDEVAADQDPQFRDYFYKIFLQELKSQYKTIIAISHDDRYFSCADRVIAMEYGDIISNIKATKKEQS